VILIAEKLSEVRAIMPRRQGDERRADDRPARAALAKGAGKWATSGGEHAKFGLSTARSSRRPDAARGGHGQRVQALHFHIGSQVPDILIIKRAVREAARYYAKLRKMGHPSSTSTSAAASPSTTTARAAPSTRR
jgi:arginine decarboxylase